MEKIKKFKNYHTSATIYETECPFCNSINVVRFDGSVILFCEHFTEYDSSNNAITFDDRLDWEEAERYLNEVKESYQKIMNIPNVNPFFALGNIAGLIERFENGERTKDIYNEIFALE